MLFQTKIAAYNDLDKGALVALLLQKDDLIAQLGSLSLTDALTGLYNRRFFDKRLREEVKLIIRDNHFSLSLLILDVDHFKRVNDLYGHQAGDQVLKGLGTVIKRSLREEDVSCRIGGEEFAIIAIHTDIAGAKVLAEKIRKNVEQERELFTLSDGKQLSCTLSLGVSVLSGYQQEQAPDVFVEKMLMEADALLYRSKAAGRNCISLPEPELAYAMR